MLKYGVSEAQSIFYKQDKPFSLKEKRSASHFTSVDRFIDVPGPQRVISPNHQLPHNF